MPRISQGFSGRRRPDVDPARVPPGQYVVNDFPVLSAGPTTGPELGQRWSVYQLRRYRMRWLRVMRRPLSQELPQRTPRDPARRDRRHAHPRARCSCSTSTR